MTETPDFVGEIETTLEEDDVIFLEDMSIYRYSLWLSVLLVGGYASVFIIGLVGNLCVIVVVHRSPRMRSATNHLIVNLAVVDIVVLLVCVPSNLLSNMIHPWLLGLWACKVTSYLQAVTVSASIQTLVAISVDRCMSICSGSFRRRLTAGGSSVRRVVGLIWAASLTLMTPILLYQDVLKQPDSPWLNCVDNAPSQEFRVLFNTVALFIGCYLLPLAIITVSYLLIYLTVWRRTIPGESMKTSETPTPKSNTKKGSCDDNKEKMMQRSKLKVVRMMLGVVSTFFISWAPLYVLHGYFLIRGFPHNHQVAAFLQIAFPVAQWLGTTNSCINPVLYGLLNKRYRSEFRALFSGRRHGSEASTGTVQLRTQFTLQAKNDNATVSTPQAENPNYLRNSLSSRSSESAEKRGSLKALVISHGQNTGAPVPKAV